MQLEIEKKVMGGRFLIKAFPQAFFHKSQTEKILQESLNLASSIEDELTDFRPSPFQKINDNAGKKKTVVSDRIIDLFETAKQYSKQSFGLFDISSGPLIQLWRRQCLGENISEQIWDEAKLVVGIEKVEIDKNNKTIYLPHPKMRLSFGGIGKGYAVDQMFNFLRSKGIENFYINGSGDIRVHSHKDAPRAWRIGIQNPFSKDYKNAGVIQIKNDACATSGNYKNTINSAQRAHHIINPQTGLSPLDIASSTVITHKCLDADVNATILMLLDTNQRIEYIEKYKLKAITIDTNGKVFMSKPLIATAKS